MRRCQLVQVMGRTFDPPCRREIAQGGRGATARRQLTGQHAAPRRNPLRLFEPRTARQMRPVDVQAEDRSPIVPLHTVLRFRRGRNPGRAQTVGNDGAMHGLGQQQFGARNRCQHRVHWRRWVDELHIGQAASLLPSPRPDTFPMRHESDRTRYSLPDNAQTADQNAGIADGLVLIQAQRGGAELAAHEIHVPQCIQFRRFCVAAIPSAEHHLATLRTEARHDGGADADEQVACAVEHLAEQARPEPMVQLVTEVRTGAAISIEFHGREAPYRLLFSPSGRGPGGAGGCLAAKMRFRYRAWHQANAAVLAIRRRICAQKERVEPADRSCSDGAQGVASGIRHAPGSTVQGDGAVCSSRCRSGRAEWPLRGTNFPEWCGNTTRPDR